MCLRDVDCFRGIVKRLKFNSSSERISNHGPLVLLFFIWPNCVSGNNKSSFKIVCDFNTTLNTFDYIFRSIGLKMLPTMNNIVFSDQWNFRLTPHCFLPIGFLFFFVPFDVKISGGHWILPRGGDCKNRS